MSFTTLSVVRGLTGRDKKMTVNIEYKVNKQISVDEFIDLFKRSTLDERRPIENIKCSTMYFSTRYVSNN